MDTRPTLIALILAVVTVGFAVLTAGGDGRPAAAGNAGPLLSAEAWPIDAVTTLELRAEERPAHRWVGRGLTWDQVEPIPHPMDGPIMRRVLAAAGSVERSAVVPETAIEEAGGIAGLGLDPPAAELRASWTGGSTAIRLGRRGVAGRAFAQVRRSDAGDEAGASGDWGPVLVIDQTLHRVLLDQTPRSWRDRRLLPGADVDATAITWRERAGRDDGQSIRLERSGGRWRMTSPITTRVDQAALGELVQGLASSSARGFVIDDPDDLGRFGLEPPAVTLEIERPGTDGSADAGPLVLRIGAVFGATSSDRFGLVEGRPTVVRIDGPTLARLIPDPATLVDPVASGTAPSLVEGLRIDGPAGTFDLARDLQQWIAPDHGGRVVDTVRVESLLDQLTNLRAPAVTIAPYPRDMHVATVTLLGAGGGAVDTVRILRDPANGNWALENGDGALRIFPPALDPPLTPAEFGLRRETRPRGGKPFGG